MQTGVGRTGESFFAIQDSDIVPDFITFAKGIGNGAALGGVISKEKHTASLKGKVHFNTFGGDPYQSMQASKVIDLIKEESLIENSARMGHKLKEGLLGLKERYPIIGDVRGRGLMQAIELVKDRKTKEPAPQECAKLLNLTKDQGLLLGKGGLYGNVIRIAPPMSLKKSEVEELLEKLGNSLEALS